MSQYQNINQSHLKNDECYINQQNKENKSIFNYMTDQTKFINNNECFDLTPPFLNYIPAGTPKQNIDIENDLRGAIRNNTKCASCKFTPPQPNLASNGLSKQPIDFYPNNKQTCKPEFMILPNGYIVRKQ